MLLAIAATEIEMVPLRQLMAGQESGWLSLVGGVGPVETTLRLTRFLCTDEIGCHRSRQFRGGGGISPTTGTAAGRLCSISVWPSERYSVISGSACRTGMMSLPGGFDR